MKEGNIKDSYKLSPTQQGMFFHTLYAPNSGVYIEQFICTLHGNLNVSVFKRAWQQVVNRHTILRTSFFWKSLDKPLQFIHQQIFLPLDKQDWRGLSFTEQQKRIEAFLQSDRERGFELSRAPLIRLTLIQVAEYTYQFIWSYHHILLDGWSSRLIIKEVFAFYKAFCQGEDLHLKTPRPYQDYINWLQKQDMIRAEAFWKRKLKGFTAPTPLVVNRVSDNLSARNGYRAQEIRLSVATNALQSLGWKNQMSLNILVKGTWALLLNYYSGEKDVVFGTTVSGRPTDLDGVESMVGLFINSLPIRVHISLEDSILPLIKNLQNYQVKLCEHEYSPLVQIHKWSDLPSNLPLFESILDFERYTIDTSILHQGKSGEKLEVSNIRCFSRTNYPLTILIEAEPQLSLKMLYDCQNFDDATITRMLGHFRTLLQGIIANPEQPLYKQSILTNRERHQMLIEWNNTRTDFDPHQCVHRWFELQVDRTPEAVAVNFENSDMTYNELNKRANQLAHYLQKLGVGPNVLVGIYLKRSIEMVVGLLAILKAGGVCVALDLSNPKERLEFMLKDSQLMILLTQMPLLKNISTQECTKVCLDSDWEVVSNESDENTDSNVMVDSLMYAIYTTGSTGKPKCAGITHRVFLNLLNWQFKHSKLRKKARTVQFATFGFCVSFQEIFSTLCSGSTLVLISEEDRRDIEGLPVFLKDNNIERLHLPFVALKRFAEVLSTNGQLPANLQEIITAGEQLQISPSIRKLFSRFPNCTLHNHYGTSEIHVVSAFSLSGSPENWSTNVPIGRPIDNTQFYVLDSYLRPVPVEVPGELYVGGICVGDGYLNSPELTAEKFIPNPFSQILGERLFRTGDRVRYLPDGNVEFLGRVDYLVKIRGFRIEPGEIETVLNQHSDIKDSVVIALTEPIRGRYLVAYIVPIQDSALLINKLHNYLRKKIPEYMIPTAFVILDALPITPTGKVDRRALPKPELLRPDIGESFVAPRTPVEEILAGIWSAVLKLNKVGVHDNFFDLGGHSLLAIQVVSRIRQAFQIELPLSYLFDAPTVASLSRHIETIRDLAQALQIPPNARKDGRDEIEL